MRGMHAHPRHMTWSRPNCIHVRKVHNKYSVAAALQFSTGMSAHHDATNGPPATKRSKMDDGAVANGSYIPTEKEDGLQFSVVFSMKEEKGALVKALELCKVSLSVAKP